MFLYKLQVILLGKPAPVIYEAAMQLLGLTSPGEVLAIGDSLEHDIAGEELMLTVIALSFCM